MSMMACARGVIPLALGFSGEGDAGASPADDPFERRAIAAAGSGDHQAFDFLVEKYGRRVISLAAGLIRNRADAEDLAQEAFVRAYRALPQFRRGERFAPWIYRIVTNLAMDLMRQRKRRGNVAGEEELMNLPAAESSDTVAEGRQAAQRIDRAIQSLPEMQRVVARLFLVEEFSHTEIAAMVGLSEGTIRSHLFHARVKLKEELKDLA